MLFSKSHGFLFIHVYKTGGTSITKHLSAYSKWLEPQHALAQEAKDILGNAFDKAFKFGYVRNPWDWLASLYYFIRKRVKHPEYKKVHKMDFETFVKFKTEEHPGSQQKKFLYIDNKLAVDYVGRFETLYEDLDKICDRIGLELPVSKLPKINVMDRPDYRRLYTKKTRSIVEQAYAEDIITFGYTFDNGQIRKNRI